MDVALKKLKFLIVRFDTGGDVCEGLLLKRPQQITKVDKVHCSKDAVDQAFQSSIKDKLEGYVSDIHTKFEELTLFCVFFRKVCSLQRALYRNIF